MVTVIGLGVDVGDLTEKGKLSRSKINIMTVYESKGLEFTSVAVAPEEMSDSEKYIDHQQVE